MKYLVMESADTYAILLDEEGRFVKSANLGYEVGETVMDPILMRDTPLEKVKDTPKRLNRVLAVVAAVAAMLAVVFGVNYYQEMMSPYSTILMAINPEVEMVLNKKGDVLEVNGTNADGRQLVEGYEPNRQDKTEVANELIDRAIEMGFLADGGRVSIAINTPDQALFEQYGIEMRRSLDGRMSIEIEITDIDNHNPKPNEAPAADEEEDDDLNEDDSGYDEPEVEDDDSGYDDSAYDAPAAAPATQAPPAPAPKAPAPKPQQQAPQPKPDDDSGYDDTGYEDTDYDDTDYDEPETDDDSEYEEDDEDDSEYGDSDYDSDED